MKKIEMGKKYRTRDGRDAEVARIDLQATFRPVLAIITEPSGKQWAQQFTEYGSPYECVTSPEIPETDDDLVEVSPYADIPIDTPGWARTLPVGIGWTPAYFAGVGDSGRPMCWSRGQTSFTTGQRIGWDEFTTSKPEGV
jgi:hypothetical protein